jgi:hypothetical protein
VIYLLTPLGFFVGYALGYFRTLPWLTGWACHLYARALGGQWFTKRQSCRGCGRRIHVLADSPQVLEAGLEDDDGRRCPSCAKGAAA